MSIDFQELCDSMAAMTCIMSVEKRADGYGEIRIVTGNASYVKSIERPQDGVELLTKKFVPNSEYTNYLTQDLNFEDFCYRSAVQKKCLHSYVHPDRIPLWFNLSFIPLDTDDDDLCYCLYIMEVDMQPDSEHMSNMASLRAARVLQTAIKLRSAIDFNSGMGEVIQDLREMCGAEHCCILLVDDFERTCSVLCEDLADGSPLPSMASFINDGFYDVAEQWENTISGSNCLIVKNDYEMSVLQERNPAWHGILKATGVDSIALFPLKTHNRLLGYIWALNYSPEKAGDIKEILEATTFMLASEIDSHMLMSHFKFVSSHDMLTGLLNRNEMSSVIEELASEEKGKGEPVGIVFADLNGLKSVNDKGGHNAGDALLKDAASALREVFDDHEIFRVGGDEFTAILIGASEDELAAKADAIRKASEHYDNVSFAIGTCYEPNATVAEKALRKADERMYEDKRAFYESNPDKNRRA